MSEIRHGMVSAPRDNETWVLLRNGRTQAEARWCEHRNAEGIGWITRDGRWLTFEPLSWERLPARDDQPERNHHGL